jgi:hypothetical protein
MQLSSSDLTAPLVSWCGWRSQCRQQLCANELGDRHRAAHIPDRILHVAWRLLAVVELLAIQIDFEATLSNRRQRDADFAVTSGANLSCETGSLPEVPSRNAVLDLQLNLAFGHFVDLLGSQYGAEQEVF